MLTAQPDAYVIGHNQTQIDWANDILAGYVVGQWQPVRSTPWSSVSSIATSKGLVFLKSMAKPFCKEPAILALIEKHAPGYATRIIVANNDLQCFLMHDAGHPLRETLLSNFRTDYPERALTMCADIQIAMIQHVDNFIKAGVNDWRLVNIPSLYQKFIHDRIDILKEYGMSPSEITDYEDLGDPISDTCNVLADYDIPQTLEHSDFHDNNILIRDNRLVIGDWGDASIGHPFFSCVSFFDSAQRHHLITDQMKEHLIQIYLKKWTKYGNTHALRRAYQVASKLYYVIVGMSHVRFYDCLNIENFPEYRDFTPKALEKLKEKLKTKPTS